MTPEDDAAYMDAVKRGDMDTAQEMVNELAKSKGATFHRGKDPRTTNYVIEFADNPDEILSYGEHQYVHLPEHLIEIPEWVRDYAQKYYGEQGYSKSQIDRDLNPEWIVDSAGVWDDNDFVSALWSDNEDKFYDLLDSGIVGFKTNDGAVSFPQGPDGNRFKIADPVTYDDAGNVIPLSQRFNLQNPDEMFMPYNMTTIAGANDNDIMSAYEKIRDMPASGLRGEEPSVETGSGSLGVPSGQRRETAGNGGLPTREEVGGSRERDGEDDGTVNGPAGSAELDVGLRWSKAAAESIPQDVRDELRGITQSHINYYRAKVGLPPLESK